MSRLNVDPTMIGYCTNVHAGKDLSTTMQQLQTHAVAVRQALQQQQLAVGLWLSNQTALQLVEDSDSLEQFSQWLNQNGLIPYTLNGFPFGDFHQEVVKLEVYKPTWAEADRLQYTVNLAHILAQLLKERSDLKENDRPDGTISTLPIGWPTGNETATKQQAAANLLQLVQQLSELREATGVWIQVCIEPEPGCILGDFPSALRYFEDYLLVDQNQNDKVRKHLSICYDICHSAVMNESATDNLQQAKDLGIAIGKVQVSSAVTIDFDSLSDSEKDAALQRIQSFAEPRYMHQTTVVLGGETNSDCLQYFDDLPAALDAAEVSKRGRWTIHFHVPICQSDAGLLQTTQAEIGQFIQQVQHFDIIPTHWEVETYAWNVLPKDMQRPTLAEGIADEIRWLQQQLK